MIVIDTNILMSALIKDGLTRRILVHSGRRFAYPEIALEEITRHRDLVLRKSGYTPNELDEVLSGLLRSVTLIATSAFQQDIARAAIVMRDIDITDTVFVALALSLNATLWSDDAHLRKQNLVMVCTTSEMMNLSL